jgi:hypothetical protein
MGDGAADMGRFVALVCSYFSSYVKGQTIAVVGGQAWLG